MQEANILVRITVTESECRCSIMKSGESYLVDDVCPPVCHELWHQIYPCVYALKNGAQLDYGSVRSRQFDAVCPDGGRVKIHGEIVNKSEMEEL